MQILGLGSKTNDGFISAIRNSIEQRIEIQKEDGSKVNLSKEEAENLEIVEI